MSAGGQDGKIRAKIVEEDLVDCMIALPSQLFYNTGIPACLWFLAKDKSNDKFRSRNGETLFIDARKMGVMVDRAHRELTTEDIKLIVNIYHSWRSEFDDYEDIRGFCKSVELKEIEKQGHILTPGRYVGVKIEDEDEEIFEQKMKRLTSELKNQINESKILENKICDNLGDLGYEF